MRLLVDGATRRCKSKLDHVIAKPFAVFTIDLDVG
jgi:hypothetical protein